MRCFFFETRARTLFWRSWAIAGCPLLAWCCRRVVASVPSACNLLPFTSWRDAVALPRRFGRVCWNLAALRRGAGRRVPLPIRIACSTGKFQLMRQFAGTDPHDVERRRGLSHASKERSHRPLGAWTNDGILITLWKLAVAKWQHRRAISPSLPHRCGKLRKSMP